MKRFYLIKSDMNGGCYCLIDTVDKKMYAIFRLEKSKYRWMEPANYQRFNPDYLTRSQEIVYKCDTKQQMDDYINKLVTVSELEK